MALPVPALSESNERLIAGQNVEFEYAQPSSSTTQSRKKKKKKKKKSKSTTAHEDAETDYPASRVIQQGPNGDVIVRGIDPLSSHSIAEATATAALANDRGTGNVDSDVNGTKKHKTHSGKNSSNIWNMSSLEEQEGVREFWLSLSEAERKDLVKIEKDAVLKTMKEQQKLSCSCSVCGRKRNAIEEELEMLYDSYYAELEQGNLIAPDPDRIHTGSIDIGPSSLPQYDEKDSHSNRMVQDIRHALPTLLTNSVAGAHGQSMHRHRSQDSHHDHPESSHEHHHHNGHHHEHHHHEEHFHHGSDVHDSDGHRHEHPHAHNHRDSQHTAVHHDNPAGNLAAAAPYDLQEQQQQLQQFHQHQLLQNQIWQQNTLRQQQLAQEIREEMQLKTGRNAAESSHGDNNGKMAASAAGNDNNSARPVSEDTGDGLKLKQEEDDQDGPGITDRWISGPVLEGSPDMIGPPIPPSRSQDFLESLFHINNNFQAQGSIMTVADDLLKNDGRKFIEMMEQLAERRLAREEGREIRDRDVREVSGAANEDEDTLSADLEDSDEFYDDEELEDDEENDYYDDEDEDDDLDSMSEEQRIEEGRRMIQIFTTRMFHQRLLQAYRERVADERRERFLEELAEEERKKKEKEEKKLKEKEKKRDKRRQQKQAKEEERIRKEAEKAEAERKLKEEQERKAEEARKKKEEARKKRELERKAAEEARIRKIEELERQRREREEQAELKRKQEEEAAAAAAAAEKAKREAEAAAKAEAEKKAEADAKAKSRNQAKPPAENSSTLKPDGKSSQKSTQQSTQKSSESQRVPKSKDQQRNVQQKQPAQPAQSQPQQAKKQQQNARSAAQQDTSASSQKPSAPANANAKDAKVPSNTGAAESQASTAAAVSSSGTPPSSQNDMTENGKALLTALYGPSAIGQEPSMPVMPSIPSGIPSNMSTNIPSNLPSNLLSNPATSMNPMSSHPISFDNQLGSEQTGPSGYSQIQSAPASAPILPNLGNSQQPVFSSLLGTPSSAGSFGLASGPPPGIPMAQNPYGSQNSLMNTGFGGSTSLFGDNSGLRGQLGSQMASPLNPPIGNSGLRTASGSNMWPMANSTPAPTGFNSTMGHLSDLVSRTHIAEDSQGVNSLFGPGGSAGSATAGSNGNWGMGFTGQPKPWNDESRFDTTAVPLSEPERVSDEPLMDPHRDSMMPRVPSGRSPIWNNGTPSAPVPLGQIPYPSSDSFQQEVLRDTIGKTYDVLMMHGEGLDARGIELQVLVDGMRQLHPHMGATEGAVLKACTLNESGKELYTEVTGDELTGRLYVRVYRYGRPSGSTHTPMMFGNSLANHSGGAVGTGMGLNGLSDSSQSQGVYGMPNQSNAGAPKSSNVLPSLNSFSGW